MKMSVIPPADADPRKLVTAIRQLAEGRSNAVGTVTLAASAAATAVPAPTCGKEAKIFLFPATANAAAELGNGTAYVKAADITAGQFIVTHANSLQTDRTFHWLAIG
jgi:hypothetical protein